VAQIQPAPSIPAREEIFVPVAERLLLDIIDTVREPLLVLDPDFRIAQANRAFFRTFLVKREDTIGRVLFTLGDGQWDIPPLRELLRDKLAIEPELQDFEVDHVFPGIGRKIMMLNARMVLHAPHSPRVILLAIEDVTQRRYTEWRLDEHRRELERSNAALDEYAAVTSHDLQEPLRKILSFGERLERSIGGTITGDARHSLDRMLNAATRMRALVQDVLAYSQVTTRIQPFTQTVLSWVARDALVDLDARVAEASATIEIGKLPVIDADALQMRQLFQNLLSNGIKYRRDGVPPVIKVHYTNGVENECVIHFVDNGIGFNEEYAEKIFKMFERLHGRSKYEGSGIGLAICRKIVGRHGGTIAATSIAGQGATFTVTLPVTHAATDAAK
jgi:two-component system CheB/CheR fusion protein